MGYPCHEPFQKKTNARLRLNFQQSLSSENLHIKEYTALGDSYAAGIGAGSNIDSKCSVYNSSYPLLLDRDPHLGSREKRTLHDRACAGATSFDVIRYQLPSLGNSSVATLSTGGNDAHFFRVIDACIYRFNGPWAGDCEHELLESEARLRSYLFYFLEHTYNAVLDAAAHPDFRLYVTGYARFFNENTTQCNDVDFNYWKLPGRRNYLTKELRARINELVTMLGEEIAAAVERVNGDRGEPRVVYVDYDRAFEGHRFCEEGV